MILNVHSASFSTRRKDYSVQISASFLSSSRTVFSGPLNLFRRHGTHDRDPSSLFAVKNFAMGSYFSREEEQLALPPVLPVQGPFGPQNPYWGPAGVPAQHQHPASTSVSRGVQTLPENSSRKRARPADASSAAEPPEDPSGAHDDSNANEDPPPASKRRRLEVAPNNSVWADLQNRVLPDCAALSTRVQESRPAGPAGEPEQPEPPGGTFRRCSAEYERLSAALKEAQSALDTSCAVKVRAIVHSTNGEVAFAVTVKASPAALEDSYGPGLTKALNEDLQKNGWGSELMTDAEVASWRRGSEGRVGGR